MARNSKSHATVRTQGRDVKRIIRIVLGVLLGLNVIAAGLVLFPPGGSADDLEREMASLQSQAAQKRALLERTKLNVAAVETARGEGDKFLTDYFLGRRVADSALLSELTAAATKAQIEVIDGLAADVRSGKLTSEDQVRQEMDRLFAERLAAAVKGTVPPASSSATQPSTVPKLSTRS